MSDKPDGGPAFPTQDYDRGAAQAGFAVSVTDKPGMSLRDWFAGQANVAVAYDLLHREGCEELIGEPMPEDMLGMVKWRLKVAAALKFLEADAMLAARDA